MALYFLPSPHDSTRCRIQLTHSFAHDHCIERSAQNPLLNRFTLTSLGSILLITIAVSALFDRNTRRTNTHMIKPRQSGIEVIRKWLAGPSQQAHIALMRLWLTFMLVCVLHSDKVDVCSEQCLNVFVKVT